MPIQYKNNAFSTKIQTEQHKIKALKECITIIKDRIIREIPYSKKVKERK